MVWAVFYVTLPLRLYTNWLAFFALLVGVMRKHGYPKFNKAFLQKILLDDNL